MPLKNYLKIVRSNKVLIYVCIVICGILALIFSLTRHPVFESSISFSVHKINRQNSKDFQYDNYYAIQASELLGNTMVGWLESPDIVFEIYDKAELTPQANELNRLVKGMKAKQISSHIVKVRFSQEDETKVNNISNSLIEVIKNKVKTVEIMPDGKSSFEVVASNPVIVKKEYDPVLITIIGLASGLFLGIGLAFIFEYFKE